MTGTGDHIELPESDPEPERYYDWILWKLRQKQKWTEKMNDEYIYESPDKGKTVYRRKMGDTERELIKESKVIIPDMVNSPPHYNKGIETTEYINSYDMGF